MTQTAPGGPRALEWAWGGLPAKAPGAAEQHLLAEGAPLARCGYAVPEGAAPAPRASSKPRCRQCSEASRKAEEAVAWLRGLMRRIDGEEREDTDPPQAEQTERP